MFDAARRRLTLWNVLIIVLVLAVFGAGVYFWTAERLVGEVDAALARLAGQVAREVGEHEDAWLGGRPGAGHPPANLEEPAEPGELGDPQEPGELEEPGEYERPTPAEDASPGGAPAPLGPGPAREEQGPAPDDAVERLRGILRREETGRPQAALLVGTAVAWRSPGAPGGFPSAELAVEARRRGRPVVATLVLDGRPWRVRAEPLSPGRRHDGRQEEPGGAGSGGDSGTGARPGPGPGPEEPPVVQVALPLAAVEDSLAALLRVLVLAGAGGVGLAAAAGYAQA